jgi:hypothetical protein
MAKAKSKAKSSKRTVAKKSTPFLVSAPAEEHSLIIQFGIVFIIVAALAMAFYLGKMMGFGQ